MEEFSILVFVLGTTQIIKDAGFVRGTALQVVAVVLGGLATYMSIYQPLLLVQITPLLQVLGLTGGISFLDERRKAKKE